MGNNSSRTETINWDKIKTDNVETPTLKHLGTNANNLITKLNLPKELFNNNLDTETEIDLLDVKTKNNNLISLDLNSSTSPFISSEKYLSLTSKLQNNLQNNLNQLGGALDDESSTSDTEEEQKLKEKNKKEHKSLKLSDRLSYLSSSAHTENNSENNTENNSENNSDNEENSDDENDEQNSNQTTPDNIQRKNKKSKKVESSEDEDELDDDEDNDDEDLMGGSETVYSTTIDNEVNTSDINLV